MKRTPEHNERIKNSLIGRKLSPEHRAALSTSHRKYLKIDLVEAALYLSNQENILEEK